MKKKTRFNQKNKEYITIFELANGELRLVATYTICLSQFYNTTDLPKIISGSMHKTYSKDIFGLIKNSKKQKQ